jgi:ABC-type branched-subunit amino acid transport system substrate-binding protein
MAAKEINDAGGVLGAKIQLFPGDTEATAPKATEIIEKLYYTDKVDTVVGAYSSEEATAFQEQSAKLKMNILYQGTTHILDDKYKADPEKYKYHWTYSPSDIHFMEYMRDLVLPLFVGELKKQLGLDKINVAVITDLTLASESLYFAWQDYVKARPDCRLVYAGKIARDAVDFAAELTELRAKNTQLLLYYNGYPSTYPFMSQFYNVKVPASICGMNPMSWTLNEYKKAIGIDAAAYNSSMGFNSFPTTPNTVKLIKKYESLYGGQPHLGVGFCYNGVKAYAKAVEMARSLNHDKVQKALQKVRLPESESWNCREFYFEDTHRVNVSPKGFLLAYFQITPTGDFIILDPKEYKTGTPLIPPWLVQQWKKK